MLAKTIGRFRALQLVYTPGVKPLIESHSADAVNAEDITLWLPSEVDAKLRPACCIPRLPDIEARLRKGQCFDALTQIRHLIRAKTHLIQFRNKNVRGQRPNTRTAGAINRLDNRLSVAIAKYRRARDALSALLGPGDWERELKILRDEDVRLPGGMETCIENPDDTIGPDGKKKGKKKLEALAKGLGEGRRVISWIWVSGGLVGEGGDKGLNDGQFCISFRMVI